MRIVIGGMLLISGLAFIFTLAAIRLAAISDKITEKSPKSYSNQNTEILKDRNKND